MSRIVFRCDANAENGYGHFSRCLNTARGIRLLEAGADIIFLGDYTAKHHALLARYDLAFINFTEHDPNNAANLKDHFAKADRVVLDSYRITQKYINEIVSDAYKMIVIDDYCLYDLSEVDLVINFCIDAKKYTYRAKEQALGVSFFPCKPELKKVREQKSSTPQKPEVENIFIAVGGIDRYNIGPAILNTLDQVVKNKHFTYLSAGNSGQLQLANNQLQNLSFTENIEELYLQSDLAITGGGLMKYESAFCCIPNGNLPQTVDEAEESEKFSANHLAALVCEAFAYDHEKSANNLQALLTEKQRTVYWSHAKSVFETDSLLNMCRLILKN